MTRGLRVIAAALLLSACQKAAEVKPATARDAYLMRCAACHQVNGEGYRPYYPPLAGSKWVDGPPERLAAIILGGMQGPDGGYNGVMPAWSGILNDAEIADLMTYLRQMDGKPPYSAIQVNVVRSQTAARNTFWTVEDLENLGIHGPN
jgi:mono/diheme cytochrome c family protein